MQSIIRRHVSKVLGLGALLACTLAGGGDAQAAEVAPQVVPMGGMNVTIQYNGGTAFGCPVNVAADGSFTCGTNISGRVFAVTNSAGVVTGHGIRFTRQASPTISESYEGAYMPIAPGNPSVWMTGTRTVTEQRQSCVLLRCFTVTLQSTPLPFMGSITFGSG